MMDSFNSLIWALEKLLDKHPEIHFMRPKNYTEIDLREIEFILKDTIRGEVVVSEDIASWLDKAAFYRAGAGRSYDC